MVEKNIFISHIHENDEKLEPLQKLLSKYELDTKDSSIRSGKENKAKDENYIKYTILAPRIRWASTMIVYISEDTKDSEWVNWEIELAYKLGKRIIGVWGHGEAQCEIPENLKKYGDALIPMHGEEIVNAVLHKSPIWREPCGKNIPNHTITRANC